MSASPWSHKVLCIGAGYVGGPTMAVIAARCPDVLVTVVDVNADKIARWNTDDLPIFEPGLLEVVKEARGRNLFFHTDVARGIREADIIFVSVNTPTKTFGLGAGMASDLQYWEATARQIVEHSDRGKIIVEKSTLPVKTAEAMERILHANPRGMTFEVLSNPEFLAEGSAVKDLEKPDRVLIGAHATPAGQKAMSCLVDIYARWIPRERILTAGLWSAELSKLVANAFLAQRISSINSISALCEKAGADIGEIAHAIGTDTRIGAQFLNASVGFGGSCFKKDILNLVYIARGYGLEEVASYWEGVLRINDHQQERFVHRVVGEMFHTLVGKRIAVFGFAFKANTGDTRESPAISVVRRLLAERAVVVIHDPQALDNARHDLADCEGVVEFVADPYQAAAGASAIALLTEWESYQRLDYTRIYEAMKHPAFLFDGRNLLDIDRLHAIGFNVYPVGRPARVHFQGSQA